MSLKEIPFEDKILRRADLQKYLGFGRSKIDEMVKKEELLKPTQYGGTPIWKLSQIQKFIQSL